MFLMEKVVEMMISRDISYQVVNWVPGLFSMPGSPKYRLLSGFLQFALFCIAMVGSFYSRSIPNFRCFALDFTPFCIQHIFLYIFFFLLYDRTPSNERTIDDLN